MQYYYSILTSIITALFYCRITVFLMQTWYQVQNKIRQLMKTDISNTFYSKSSLSKYQICMSRSQKQWV